MSSERLAVAWSLQVAMKMTLVRSQDAAQDPAKAERISASFIREIALLKVPLTLLIGRKATTSISASAGLYRCKVVGCCIGLYLSVSRLGVSGLRQHLLVTHFWVSTLPELRHTNCSLFGQDSGIPAMLPILAGMSFISPAAHEHVAHDRC